MSSTTTGAVAPGIPTLKLNDGNEIPMLAYGLGSANAKRGAKAGPGLDQDLIDITTKAIKAGYVHLDGAEVYKNEPELGAAIAASGVPRSQLYVVTKLFTPSRPQGLTTAEHLTASLSRLGLDYVDLYLIHSPLFAGPAEASRLSPASALLLQSQWAEMEALVATGMVRSIGVSNYLRGDLESVLQTAKIVPAVNQIEFHAYLQHVSTQDAAGNEMGKEEDLLAFMRERGVAAAAYGPLTAVTRAAPGPVDEVHERLAGKYGVSVGDVALRWCIDEGVVAITTSEKEGRLRGYVEGVGRFRLEDGEREDVRVRGREKHFRAFWCDKFGEGDRR